MANWDPIETAPKDGTDILAAREPSGRQLVVSWDVVSAQWLAVDQQPVFPTHWQELPKPPKFVAEPKSRKDT